MGQKGMDRRNALARKANTPEGLPGWGKEERAVLRRAYIDSVLGSWQGHLGNTYFVDEKGNKKKLEKKEK